MMGIVQDAAAFLPFGQIPVPFYADSGEPHFIRPISAPRFSAYFIIMMDIVQDAALSFSLAKTGGVR